MIEFLLLAFVFLVAGVFAVSIAFRLRLGSVLGYLIAGILISPLLAVLNFNLDSIQHFAEFGVVMMLFLVGLELEPKLLWSMRLRLLGLGGGQIALTTAAITAIGMALGQPASISLAIGLILSLSSTAVVLQTLNEINLMKSKGGRASFSVLLFQDIAFIPMLALLPLLALPAFQEAAQTTAMSGTGLSLVDGLNGWQKALVSGAAIAAVVLGGSLLTEPLFGFIAASRLRELFTATALLMVIGIALLMLLVGLSPALGTFLAGVVLANSKYSHELESDIAPFKGLLLGLFFMTIGAGINFALLVENLGVIVGLTLGLILLKFLILLALGWLFQLRRGDKWLFALGLAQAGEFGFVLLSFTVANGVIPAAIADQLLLVVAISMLLTPLLFILHEHLIVPRLNAERERQADSFEESNHVIIAGQGRVGGLIHRMLRAAGYSATVIDFSSKQLDIHNRFGMRVNYGDGTRPELLHAAGIANAKLLIIAIDGKKKTTKLAKYVSRTYPSVHIIARARNRDHVYDLYAAGCRDIIRETYDGALRMGRSAYEVLGASEEQAELMKQAFDSMDRKSVVAMAEHYDPNIPSADNDAYVAKVKEYAEMWEKDLEEQMAAILSTEKTGKRDTFGEFG